jgi:quercetin dioxygenase-like cupin family protein
MSKAGEDAMATWSPALREEFETHRFNPCVGQLLLSETPRVRVWSLSLQPGERLGFHRHQLDYFWTVLTDGRSRSHYHDGRVQERSYVAGETQHMAFGAGEYMIHDLENIGDTVLAYTTVEFLDSANPALPVPDMARRKAA